ncbi:MAG: KH domain-containing protein [Candidatus Kerfeldbacteria bacterium]|nr:KH domain-containing protein [Candidatus Kerfeldbacteria bacterium]
MTDSVKDQEFVEYVVKSLVDNPEAVRTERTVDEMGVLITLHVDPQDLGQVIGRSGQTAKSLRTLLRVVGAKNQARVNLKIYEPEGSRPPRAPREPREAMAPASDEADTSALDDLKL